MKVTKDLSQDCSGKSFFFAVAAVDSVPSPLGSAESGAEGAASGLEVVRSGGASAGAGIVSAGGSVEGGVGGRDGS